MSNRGLLGPRTLTLALTFGCFFCLDRTTRADDPPPPPASLRLPPFRPGAPKAWEQPGADLWSGDAAISAGGNLRQRFPLFGWTPPGVGAAIDVGLIQNSADAAIDGAVGKGLRLAVTGTLRVGAGTVSVEEADGTPRVFRLQGGAYVGETFDHDRLEPSGDGWLLHLPHGLTREFTRGQTGKFVETARRDRVDDVTRFTYDAGDRLVEVKDSAGRSARFRLNGTTYDAIIDPEGHTFALHYAYGFLVQVEGPPLATGQAPTLNLYWDAPTRQLVGRSSWSGGPGAIFTYDAGNRVTSVKPFDGGEERVLAYGEGTLAMRTAAGTFQWRYEDEALVERVDPQGRRWGTTRDARKRPAASVDTFGKVTGYTYDDADNLVATVDPAGARTLATYDARHRVISETDPFGQVTTTAYDDLDDVTSTTNAIGETTRYAYDSRGNLLGVTDFSGTRRFAATYDALGHQLTATDALGHTTTFTYDSRGSWLSVRTPDGKTVSRTTSLLGRTLTTTNELGETTTLTYDGLSRIATATDAANRRTTLSRDIEGRVIAFEDATGPVSESATITWAPDRYVSGNTVNGHAVRTAAPRSR